MIKYLSQKMASYIACDDETADYELLVYGYDLFFQEAAVYLIALIVAVPFGLLPQVLVTVAAYNLMRRYAGGTHAKHRVVCMISSVLTMFGPAFVFAKTPFRLSNGAVIALAVVDVILLLLYAPADTEIRPVQNPKKRKHMKGMAILILVCYTLAALIINHWRRDYAGILMAVSTLICCFTHPLAYRLYGCEKSKNYAA